MRILHTDKGVGWILRIKINHDILSRKFIDSTFRNEGLLDNSYVRIVILTCSFFQFFLKEWQFSLVCYPQFLADSSISKPVEIFGIYKNPHAAPRFLENKTIMPSLHHKLFHFSGL